MPPTSSKSKGKAQSRDARRSRSRNSTPVSVIVDAPSSGYLQTSVGQLVSPADSIMEDLFDRSSSGSAIPTASVLGSMLENVKQQLVSVIKTRGEASDRLMRELAQKRKDRVDQSREKERAEKAAEERRKIKEIKEKEERPLAIGAHGVARQDGVDLHKNNSSNLSSPLTQPSPSATAAAGTADSPLSPINTNSPHQPPPAPVVQHFEVFGSDPLHHPDPTVYHIRDLTDDMREEEKKQILCVTEYPKSDLHDLTAGTPPDKDFSNAKPNNQVTAQAFANFVEPYIRPLTEEDLAFLKERGDREKPFVTPARGARHYKEVWAEEDGQMHIDTNNLFDQPRNEARGSFEDMDDTKAETDDISTGPVVARLLSVMRPERRGDTDNNGDTSMTNGDTDTNGDHANNENNTTSHASATHLPESALPSWKSNPPQALPYSVLNDRILQELRYIGFLPSDQMPDYDTHEDDEVAGRLRYLQDILRRQSVINGARKARIVELASERMAQQEYSTIADDLDTQLNQAYSKRNRSMSKGAKNKKHGVNRPGVATAVNGAGGGAGTAGTGGTGAGKPVLGDTIKGLMDRRQKWNEWIGPVVNGGDARVPEQTIFGEEAMARLQEKEVEGWGETEGD